MRILILTYLILTFDAADAQKDPVRIKFHDGAFYNIIATQDENDTNLTNFNQWENIENLTISPDSNYFFFRHKADKGGSYKLTLYNLKTLKKINEITPGFGGSYTWNHLNQIIHQWGCGTNCSNVKIYNLKLNEVFFSLSSGGFLFSPQQDILIQFNMKGTIFWLFDLRTLKKDLLGFTEAGEYVSNGERFRFDSSSLHFFGSYNFKVYPPEFADASKDLYYSINQLDLTPLKPEDTNEFYERSE